MPVKLQKNLIKNIKDRNLRLLVTLRCRDAADILLNPFFVSEMKNFEQSFQKRWYGIRTCSMKVKSLERNMSSSKRAH